MSRSSIAGVVFGSVFANSLAAEASIGKGSLAGLSSTLEALLESADLMAYTSDTPVTLSEETLGNLSVEVPEGLKFGPNPFHLADVSFINQLGGATRELRNRLAVVTAACEFVPQELKDRHGDVFDALETLQASFLEAGQMVQKKNFASADEVEADSILALIAQIKAVISAIRMVFDIVQKLREIFGSGTVAPSAFDDRVFEPIEFSVPHAALQIDDAALDRFERSLGKSVDSLTDTQGKLLSLLAIQDAALLASVKSFDSQHTDVVVNTIYVAAMQLWRPAFASDMVVRADGALIDNVRDIVLEIRDKIALVLNVLNRLPTNADDLVWFVKEALNTLVDRLRDLVESKIPDSIEEKIARLMAVVEYAKDTLHKLRSLLERLAPFMPKGVADDAAGDLTTGWEAMQDLAHQPLENINVTEDQNDEKDEAQDEKGYKLHHQVNGDKPAFVATALLVDFAAIDRLTQRVQKLYEGGRELVGRMMTLQTEGKTAAAAGSVEAADAGAVADALWIRAFKVVDGSLRGDVEVDLAVVENFEVAAVSVRDRVAVLRAYLLDHHSSDPRTAPLLQMLDRLDGMLAANGEVASAFGLKDKIQQLKDLIQLVRDILDFIRDIFGRNAVDQPDRPVVNTSQPSQHFYSLAHADGFLTDFSAAALLELLEKAYELIGRLTPKLTPARAAPGADNDLVTLTAHPLLRFEGLHGWVFGGDATSLNTSEGLGFVAGGPQSASSNPYGGVLALDVASLYSPAVYGSPTSFGDASVAFDVADFIDRFQNAVEKARAIATDLLDALLPFADVARDLKAAVEAVLDVLKEHFGLFAILSEENANPTVRNWTAETIRQQLAHLAATQVDRVKDAIQMQMALPTVDVKQVVRAEAALGFFKEAAEVLHANLNEFLVAFAPMERYASVGGVGGTTTGGKLSASQVWREVFGGSQKVAEVAEASTVASARESEAEESSVSSASSEASEEVEEGPLDAAAESNGLRL